MNSTAVKKRTLGYNLLAVAALALLVRLVYVLQLADTPFFASPIIDAEYHDAWAREILRSGFGHEGVFFRAPLYPYFLALVYSLTESSFLAARIAQAGLGMITSLLTYLLGYSLTRHRWVALLAGLGAALYGMLVYFDGELLVETLYVPLFLGACLAYSEIRSGNKSFPFLLPGILLGLSVITRPTALIILPLLVLDILIRRAGHSSGPVWLPRLLRSFALVTGCFLVILPVTWHNVKGEGDFVLIASQGGINFYVGNNAAADGLHSNVPGLGSNWDVPTVSRLAYLAEGRVLKSSEVSDYYYGLGFDFILDKPLAWGRLTLKKLFAVWSRLEISNNRDLYFFKGETEILPYLRILGFWLIGPLGLLGWWLSWRRRLLPGWFLWLMPVYTLAVVAFFMTARFRLPLIPPLLICSGLAVTVLTEREYCLLDRKRLVNLALLGAFMVLVNVNFWGFERENPAHSHFSLGNAYLKSGLLPEAERSYFAALEADSSYPQIYLNLGVIAYQRENLGEAAARYLKELEVNPGGARAYNNLGVVRFEEGRLEESKLLYEVALDHDPYYRDAAVNLAQCLFKLGLESANAGETQKAAAYFDQACVLDPGKSLYHYNFALALGRLGYTEEAKTELQRTLEITPDFSSARNLLLELERLTSGISQ
jgi:tetratricopeptide (TPR) repeat protein